jgi:hypothetical protein
MWLVMTEPLTPDCPWCGEAPYMVMGGGTQAFCGSDNCPCLTWDPSKSKAENRRNAKVARWEPTGGNDD